MAENGRVTAVNGRIVEVALERPGAVSLFSRQNGGALCTVAQLDARTLRCAVLPPAAAPPVGAPVQGDGSAQRRDLDDTALAELVAGLNARGAAGVLETGIKAIDFLCPLRPEGVLGLFGGSNVGATVVMGELLHRLKGGQRGLQLVYLVRGPDLAAAAGLRATAADEGLGEWDRTGRIETSWVPAAAATDPQYASAMAGGAGIHAALVLSTGQGVRGLYPAVDGFHTRSTQLTLADAGAEHVGVWQRYQEALARTRELMSDPLFWELVAARSRRASERFQSFESAQLAKLSAGDRQRVTRVRKVERYLTQPFHIAEPFTGIPGASVPRAETVRTVAAILDGRLDQVADQALTYKGSVSY